MSFSGNLEHLPIVDVMQLLETTKKTGTLTVKNNGVEYKFGFSNGYIVSVTHPDTSMSFLNFLASKRILKEEDVQKIYESCRNSNINICDYIIANKITDTKNLKLLLTNFVELTLVDILTWQTGNFNLSVEEVFFSEEFKAYSKISGTELYISTQNTLMESLRIFDELRRDGLLKEGIFKHKISTSDSKSEDIIITEDILGLDIIDKLETKIPSVFMGIKEIDYTEPHRKLIEDIFKDAPSIEKDEIINFLAKLDAEKVEKNASFALIYFGTDRFLEHVIKTLGKNLGSFVFTTDSKENIGVIINQTKIKSLLPILISDNDEYLTEFINDKIMIIHLADLNDDIHIFDLLSKEANVVFPKPNAKNVIKTLEAIKSIFNYLKRLDVEKNYCEEILKLLNRITKSTKISEVSENIQNFLSQYYERTIFFLVQQDTLIHEKENIKIQLAELPEFKNTLKSLKISSGKINRDVENFYKYFPKPSKDHYALIPINALEKPVALIYCDNIIKDVPLIIFESIQKISNMTIENILYRKMFEKYKKSE